MPATMCSSRVIHALRTSMSSKVATSIESRNKQVQRTFSPPPCVQIVRHLGHRKSMNRCFISCTSTTFKTGSYGTREGVGHTTSSEMNIKTHQGWDVLNIATEAEHGLSTKSGWTDGGWRCNDEAEHFSLSPDLDPRSAWMSRNCQQVRANLKAYMCVSQGNQWRTVRLNSVVPWEVVGDQVVQRVLSDGP